MSSLVSNSFDYDAVIVGGGILGSAAAVELARAGMKVAIIDRREVFGGASSSQLGQLSLSQQPLSMIEPSLKGLEMWRAMTQADGQDMEQRPLPCITTAFTDQEAGWLEQRCQARAQAGVKTRMLSKAELADQAPELSGHVKAAALTQDAAAIYPSRGGTYFRHAFKELGADYFERSTVDSIGFEGEAYSLKVGDQSFSAKRVLLANGAWMPKLLKQLGLKIDVQSLVRTFAFVERSPVALGYTLDHVLRRLSLVQESSGTYAIGGSWMSHGDPHSDRGKVDLSGLISNIRLAVHALPFLDGLRLSRSWTTYEGQVGDGKEPMIGEVPGYPGLFLAQGCAEGQTAAPYLALVASQLMQADAGIAVPRSWSPTRYLKV